MSDCNDFIDWWYTNRENIVRDQVRPIYEAGYAAGQADGRRMCETVANLLTIQPPRKWAQELERRIRKYLASEVGE